MSTPRERVAAEAERRGRERLVGDLADLLSGGEPDARLVAVLGGDHGALVVDGRDGGLGGYWPRVWAARGLLHLWEPAAARAVVDATRDPSWRVREMAAKVIARHRVDEGFDAVVALREDPVARVSTAAERALRALAVTPGA